MKPFYFKFILIFLLLFLGLSAIAGGLALVLDPSGTEIGFSIEMLKHSPFPDFLLPGLFLFVVFGLFSLVVVYGLIRKNSFEFAEKINPYQKYHWSWFFAYLIGLLQVTWINIQLIWIRDFSILHALYSMVGVLIILFAHFPGTKKWYQINESHHLD